MPALIHSGVDDTFLLATSGSSSGSYDNNDVILFSGVNDNLSFSRSEGTSVIAIGTDQFISAAEEGGDAIYDLGKGLTLSFFELGAPDLKVYGFQNDPTGKVEIGTAFGQTATTTPDGHGGTLLNLGNFNYGGTVDFVHDPMKNLAAHLVLTPSQQERPSTKLPTCARCPGRPGSNAATNRVPFCHPIGGGERAQRVGKSADFR